jgi:hypothetical protein
MLLSFPTPLSHRGRSPPELFFAAAHVSPGRVLGNHGATLNTPFFPIIDLRRKLHPATLWGGGFFLATQVARILISLAPAWQGFAKGLTGQALRGLHDFARRCGTTGATLPSTCCTPAAPLPKAGRHSITVGAP